MTNKPFSWDKPLMTKDGRKAERVFSGIVGICRETELVQVTDKKGKAITAGYYEDGRLSRVIETCADLVNTSVEIEEP